MISTLARACQRGEIDAQSLAALARQDPALAHALQAALQVFDFDAAQRLLRGRLAGEPLADTAAGGETR